VVPPPDVRPSPATVAPIVRPKPSRRLLRPGEGTAYLFVLPALLLTVAFVLWPILQSFDLSFFRWLGTGPRTYVGLANYAAIVQDNTNQEAFRHNIVFVVGYTVFEIGIGFLLAALLNARIRGAVIFRSIFFIPVVIPTAIAALLWGMVLAPSLDPFSAFFHAVGLPFLAHAWLGDSDTALYTVIAITVWKNVGISMIVYLAAMQDIPSELHEAASIDGAGSLRRLISIDLPLLRPITIVLVTLSIIFAMRTFDVVWALENGNPREVLQMVSTLIVQTAFNFHQFGQASALAVVLFLVILIVAALNISLMERE
jgi:raffinose/stachyose/melibiose transport system permease protein